MADRHAASGHLQLVRPRVADVDFLAQVMPLQRLDERGLAHIASCVTRRRYSKGSTIVRQGDAPSGLYIVESGIVNHVTFTPEGREVHLALNHAPEAFGLVSLVDGRPERATAFALESCQLLILSAADFRFMLQRTPELALGVMAVLSQWLRHNQMAQQEAASLPPKVRIARLLLDLARSRGRLTLDATQDELSVIVGTTRETVNRSLRCLEQQGLVDCARGTITVVDAEGLHAAGQAEV